MTLDFPNQMITKSADEGNRVKDCVVCSFTDDIAQDTMYDKEKEARIDDYRKDHDAHRYSIMSESQRIREHQRVLLASSLPLTSEVSV